MPQRSLSLRSQSQNSWTIVKDHNKHNKIILRNEREGKKEQKRSYADRLTGDHSTVKNGETITRSLKLKANNC